MKQLKLFEETAVREFGGSRPSSGNRKCARPLQVGAPIHLVLKADGKVYSVAIHTDHLHMVVKIPDRKAYCAWIRGLTGTLSRLIGGLKWRHRPYTKIMTWGRQLQHSLKYLELNRREADFLLMACQSVEIFATATDRRLKSHFAPP